jgi:hypothetical protein
MRTPTHSIYRNVEGEVKTAGSRKPVPLPPIVIEELKQRRATSLYRSEKDYLFRPFRRMVSSLSSRT